MAEAIYALRMDRLIAFLTHDAFTIDGWCVAVCGRGRMEAVDFVAVQGIILRGERQRLMHPGETGANT